MQVLSTENGLPNNHVYALLPDSAGWMWGSTNQGLFAVSTKTGEVRSFSSGEGIQGAEFNSGAAATDAAGRFYFGGMNGVNIFLPAAALQITGTRVTITRIAAPDTVYYRYPGAIQLPLLQLAYDRAHLQIAYTAAMPNTPPAQRYEYHLNAGERWTEAAREGELHLTLAPGSYVLEIRLIGRPESVTRLRVQVVPPFYQQPLFLVLVFAGGSILIAAAFWASARGRYRQQLTHLEGEKKMQAEKERISRELHDELGARAALIAHNAGQLEKAAGKADNAVVTALTGRITNTTTDMLTALRETVWTLKQESVTAASLWMRYKNFVAKLSASYNHLHFEVVEDGYAELPQVPLHYTHALNALRILQEAAMNAVRHSGGTVITVTVERQVGRLCFLVTDNGQGFDMEVAQAAEQGNGLQNMAHRSEESHFHLIIKSPAGGGTQVCLCL
jgi:signal transduction histidine kinase